MTDMQLSCGFGEGNWDAICVRCVSDANGIERGVVPVVDYIGVGMGAHTRREVYGADAGDEKWNPEEIIGCLLSTTSGHA
jgi:hypothetical protein